MRRKAEGQIVKLEAERDRARVWAKRWKEAAKLTRDRALDRAWCSACGAELQLVRPGKYQCNSCEARDHLEWELAEVTAQWDALRKYADAVKPPDWCPARDTKTEVPHG